MALHSRLLRLRRSSLPTTMRSTLTIILVMSCVSNFDAKKDPALDYLLQFANWVKGVNVYERLMKEFGISGPHANEIIRACEAARDDEETCGRYIMAVNMGDDGKQNDDYELWRQACGYFKVDVKTGAKARTKTLENIQYLDALSKIFATGVTDQTNVEETLLSVYHLKKPNSNTIVEGCKKLAKRSRCEKYVDTVKPGIYKEWQSTCEKLLQHVKIHE